MMTEGVGRPGESSLRFNHKNINFRKPVTSIRIALGVAALASVLMAKATAAEDPTGPRHLQIGSTDTEIQQALKLCRQYTEGCDLEWYEDEAVRTISLMPYRLDAKEVTVADFEKYVKANNVTTEVEQRRSSSVTDENDPLSGYYADDKFWFNAYSVNNPKYPVVHITFADASAYCESHGKRLPTEAEWESAARGTALSSFPWGDKWEQASKYRGVSLPQRIAFPVGSFDANSDGFYDLSGNVAEWTHSDVPGDEEVIVKGGSRFSRNVANLRAAVRRLESRDYSGDDVGFRCAQTLERWPDTIQLAENTLQNNAVSEVRLADPQPPVDTSAKDKLRIEKLLASAEQSIARGEYSFALAELDRADAVDVELADTQGLRNSIRSAQREGNRLAEQRAEQAAREIAQASTGSSVKDTVVTDAMQASSPVQVTELKRVDELLQRVKVMRKVRERKHEVFDSYVNEQLSEAMAYLFIYNSSQKGN